jgi:AP endonuclease-1
MMAFDEHIGLQFLRAFHVNDSKTELGSHRDLHQNIGMGHLTIDAFRNLMSDGRHDGLPFILETPLLDEDLKKGDPAIGDVWRKEIELLYQLEAGTDADRVEQLLDGIRTLVKAAEKGKDERKALAKERKRQKKEEAGKGEQESSGGESSELSEVED